jgi:hypothetical protein
MRIYATVTAALGWFALTLQCYLTVTLSIANGKTELAGFITFFSYFTVLTNLLVAVALSFSTWAPRTRWGAFFSRATVQSGTAVYIAIVGIVYSLLLRHIWDPQGLQKIADVLLHDLIPLLYVAYWVIFVAKISLRWKDALWWLIYPAAYFTYTLLRGAAVGWYPYPFLDAQVLGYSRVSVNAVTLLAVFLMLGLIVIAIGRWMGRKEGAASSRTFLSVFIACSLCIHPYISSSSSYVRRRCGITMLPPTTSATLSDSSCSARVTPRR